MSRSGAPRAHRVHHLRPRAGLHRAHPPGRRAQPGDGPACERDLALARQSLELLSMLREKTRGNLTAEEEKLFESLLTDLRLRFVEAQAEAAEARVRASARPGPRLPRGVRCAALACFVLAPSRGWARCRPWCSRTWTSCATRRRGRLRAPRRRFDVDPALQQRALRRRSSSALEPMRELALAPAGRARRRVRPVLRRRRHAAAPRRRAAPRGHAPAARRAPRSSPPCCAPWTGAQWPWCRGAWAPPWCRR